MNRVLKIDIKCTVNKYYEFSTLLNRNNNIIFIIPNNYAIEYTKIIIQKYGYS